MHMQTKFFLWEGLVELLLWKLRTIFIFVKKKSLSDSLKFLGRLKQVWIEANPYDLLKIIIRKSSKEDKARSCLSR